MKIAFHRRRQHGARADRRPGGQGLRRVLRFRVVEIRCRRARGSPASMPCTRALRPDAHTGAADVLVLAVKPQDMRAAVASLAGLDQRQLIVSIAAGIRIDALSRWLGGHRRHRALHAQHAGADRRRHRRRSTRFPKSMPRKKRRAEAILRAVGEVVWVDDERLLDPVTAVSGSGPAYVFWFIEQLAASGEKLGLPRSTAMKLALQTVLGAAKLAAQSADPPDELRRQVTSKGGTTEAALKVFEQERLAARIMTALEAASRRGAELGDELGKG